MLVTFCQIIIYSLSICTCMLTVYVVSYPADISTFGILRQWWVANEAELSQERLLQGQHVAEIVADTVDGSLCSVPPVIESMLGWAHVECMVGDHTSGCFRRHILARRAISTRAVVTASEET